MAAPFQFVGQTISHYRIVEKLGGGGMGVVYKAEDTFLGRFIALKFLPDDLAKDLQALERFRREARAASALNHPNICTIHDFGQYEGRPFMAMELIEGCTLRTVANQRLSVESLVRLGEQIAKALKVAHAAGIIHRDIKPENVMVRQDGYVKVLDFGLARLTAAESASKTLEGRDSGTTPGALLGTIRYMSPEQARGESVTSSSDIFSLGIVLYELATGQHPFAADSQIGVLHGISSQVPLAPSRLNPEIPPPLEVILVRMMEKDFHLRPTAAEVEGVLSALSAVAAGSSPRPIISLVKRHSVGREKERAELQAGFESATRGNALLMCVAGEPGIGKTTLVEDFLGELGASDRSCYIARGRCSERLAGSEAYLPFLEALESLMHSEAGAGVAHIMKLTAPTWYVQIAPLSVNDSSAARLPADIKSTSQERMKRELAAFLQELSRLRPLIFFFDDLHWADASTVDLLRYLSTKFDSMRLLLVVTYRPTDLLLNKHPFLPVKPDLQAHGACREISLEFLFREDIESFLALEFPEHRFPVQFAELIHTKTEGNPLFMVDVLRYLCKRKVITEDGGHWTLAQSLPEIERELPESVRSMIQRKIDQLSDADRHLLVTASVQGYEFDSAVVAKALGMEAAEVEERLEALERVHAFVRSVAEAELLDSTPVVQYRFVHTLYQNALYSSLTPTRRSSLGAAVAQAMLGCYGEADPQVISKLAFLFEIARNFVRASHYFLIAAKHATRIFAHREAVALAQHGLDLLKKLPASPERDRQELDLLKIQGSCFLVLRGYAASEVAETYTRAQELCRQFDDPSELFGILRGLCLHYLLRADFGTARKLTAELLRIAHDTQDPELLVLASHAAGVTLFNQGEFLQAREHLERGIATYDPGLHTSISSRYGGYDLAVGCRIFLALVLWYVGYPDQSLRTIGEAVELAKKLKHPYSLAAAYFFSAWVHVDRHEPRLAQHCADACMKISSEEGFVFQSAHGRVVQGWALAAQDRMQEGLARMRQGIEDYGTTGAENERPHLLALIADTYARAGQLQDVMAALEEAFTVMRKARFDFNGPDAAELYRIKGELLLALSSENATQAESLFQEAMDIANQQSARSLELRAAVSLGRLYQKQHKQKQARQMLTGIYGWFTEGFGTADLKEAEALLSALSRSVC